ncbi:hypothetical protein [Nocardia transvalensis]|uniref:hypothetical protein n=1 Tax=Nocardia transvalensis TaxID=37333 RepID=UPI001895C49F|nr:hypothetical protein [Nocardia transvalensis]MBF6333116.1 hypothetical protein [Nocardia transvalensis]
MSPDVHWEGNEPNIYPGAVRFDVKGFLVGMPQCRVYIGFDWRNLDTGQSGTEFRHLEGVGDVADSAYFHPAFIPGPGRITGTFSVNGAHAPEFAPVEFVIPDYQR